MYWTDNSKLTDPIYSYKWRMAVSGKRDGFILLIVKILTRGLFITQIVVFSTPLMNIKNYWKNTKWLAAWAAKETVITMRAWSPFTGFLNVNSFIKRGTKREMKLENHSLNILNSFIIQSESIQLLATLHLMNLKKMYFQSTA